MKAGEHPLSQKPLYTCQDMWEMWDAGCSYAEGADAGYPQASKKFQNAIKEVAPYTSVEKIQELEETISRLRQELKDERSPNQDINYDMHEGRGENNELL